MKKTYLSKEEFAKLLFSARKQLNQSYITSIAHDRCVPQVIKHKTWVHKLFNKQGTWYAKVCDRTFYGISDKYYFLQGTTWLETTNPLVVYVD